MAGYLLAVAILFCIQGWSSGQEDEAYLQMFRKSACQPREMLVSIHKEHPQGTGHFFKPSCVVLQRCAGCCNDEALLCSAVQKRTVSLRIMWLSSTTQTSELEKMDFTEHVTCECRPRKVNKAKNRKCKRSQEKGQPRAKFPFV